MQTIKLRSELLIALKQGSVYLHQAQNTIAKIRTTVADKSRRLHDLLRVADKALRKLSASSRRAMVASNEKITKLGLELFIALKQLTLRAQLAKNAFVRWGNRVVDKPRRLREALRAREIGLRRILASSPDAIIVTSGDRRFVAANPKALDLFGISEANIRKFTIDAFIPSSKIPDFDVAGSSFMKREERRGKCNIRRLDGTLRVAEYVFVANFIPRQHLSRFRVVIPNKGHFRFIAMERHNLQVWQPNTNSSAFRPAGANV